MIKTQQYRSQSDSSQSDKGYLLKSYSKNHIGEILNTFSLKLGTSQRCPVSCHLLQIGKKQNKKPK